VGVVAEGGKGWMMTFISETRKEKEKIQWVGSASGRKSSSSGGDEVGEKMLRLAPIKAGRGWRLFLLTPGGSIDRLLCMRTCMGA